MSNYALLLAELVQAVKAVNLTYDGSDLLDILKEVDGSGSGLDADTVDGIEASKLIRNDLTTSQIIRGQLFFQSGDNLLQLYSTFFAMYGDDGQFVDFWDDLQKLKNVKIGDMSTPEITGATLQVDGSIVVGDGDGGTVSIIDEDGSMGISETTIPTGAKLAVGGVVSVTNGAGILVSHSKSLPQFTAVSVSGTTTIATITISSGYPIIGSFLVTINLSAPGTVATFTRLLQAAYNAINVGTLGTDTSFGALSTATVSITMETPGTIVVSCTYAAGCAAYVHITPNEYIDDTSFTIT